MTHKGNSNKALKGFFRHVIGMDKNEESEKVDAINGKTVAKYQKMAYQVQTVTNDRRKKSALVFGIASLLFVSCSPVLVGTPTPIITETPSPTATFITVPPTSTPQFGVDKEKFTNFPQSYNYLINHLDEFVKAPDPVNNRAAFDRWYTEELVPALGPISERELNLETYTFGPGYYSISLTGRPGITMTGNPNFFYFENSGIVYPVPCINITSPNHPGVTRWTYCPILFERRDPIGNRWGTGALEEIAAGSPISEVLIIVNIKDHPDKSLDWGDEVSAFVGALGRYPDSGTYANFGIGYINFFNRR